MAKKLLNFIVFLDEIQNCPNARTALKFLALDKRFDVIASGSLLGINYREVESFPVGYTEQIEMHSLDFEEFCMALGETHMIAYIKECFEKKVPLEEKLHHKAMLLFRQFLIVGGMPKSVVTYLENGRSFQKSDEEKRDILSLYRDDIMKIENKYKSKVLAIYDQIPAFLSKHEKRVILSDVEKQATFSSYHDTFFWLSDSMIANECFNCSDPNVGLSLNEDRTYVKCYMGDTGLLISHAFSENEIIEEDLYRQLLFERLSVNEGMFFENAIAQELTSKGHKLFFYTHYSEEKHRNDIEIDFLISNRSKTRYKIFPIEVKSTERYSTASLERFIEKYRERIGGAYVIHPKNLKVTEDILYIPAYMAMCLE